MYAVRAADLRRVLEFVSAQIQNFGEQDKVALDDARCVADQQRLRRVHHIVGGHAVVQPARGHRIANRFANGHGEGDHVVLDARFQFIDARHIHLRARPQCRGGFFRHQAGFGQRIGGGQLNVQPLLVAVGVAPDPPHLFSRITWNHVSISKVIPM